MKQAVFFISTARCGTQWISQTLSNICGDTAEVVHEPIRYKYESRRFLRRYDLISDIGKIKKVREHTNYIKDTINKKYYIEIGFPSYAAIPFFKNEFNDRIKLVHLIRNPVYTAASMSTLDFYNPQRDYDSLNSHTLPYPTDQGVVQEYYSDWWDDMSIFEKCLFYWNEIQLYSMEINQRYYDTPFLTIRYEDLINEYKNTLKSLIEFIGIPLEGKLESRKKNKVDSYKGRVGHYIQWDDVFDHPQTEALALRYGYDLSDIDDSYIRRRYQFHRSKVKNVLAMLKRRVVG